MYVAIIYRAKYIQSVATSTVLREIVMMICKLTSCMCSGSGELSLSGPGGGLKSGIFPPLYLASRIVRMV